jgi:hypothetical protein
MSEHAPAAPTVRFGRRQSKGLLLGLSGPRVAVLALAIAVFVPAIFLGQSGGALVAAPLWGGLVASAFVRWQGRPLIENLPILGHYAARTANQQLRYLHRASAPRPAGTMALPGDAAALRFHVDPISGAVMVHDPHRATLSAVCVVTHPAYALLAPDDRAQRVTGWGRALAHLSASGQSATIQILEATLPDPGLGIIGYWHNHAVADDTSWAAREYHELMTTTAPSSSAHRSTITVSLDLKQAAKAVRDAGRGITGAAAVLRQDLDSVEKSLTEAGLRVQRWLPEADLAALIRSSYDPADTSITADSPGAKLSVAGPVAVEEHWGYLTHDSAVSTVLWISEWPRIDVAPHFLHPLVFAAGVRKTLSVVAKPLSTAEALRDIRKQKVEYLTDAEQKANAGRIADLSDAQEFQDVQDRERALIAGHADYQFSGFLTVTAPDLDALTSAVATIERAATQAGCETRILHGQQAQAFTVAALPLGRGVH